MTSSRQRTSADKTVWHTERLHAWSNCVIIRECLMRSAIKRGLCVPGFNSKPLHEIASHGPWPREEIDVCLRVPFGAITAAKRQTIFLFRLKSADRCITSAFLAHQHKFWRTLMPTFRAFCMKLRSTREWFRWYDSHYQDKYERLQTYKSNHSYFISPQNIQITDLMIIRTAKQMARFILGKSTEHLKQEVSLYRKIHLTKPTEHWKTRGHLFQLQA